MKFSFVCSTTRELHMIEVHISLAERFLESGRPREGPSSQRTAANVSYHMQQQHVIDISAHFYCPSSTIEHNFYCHATSHPLHYNCLNLQSTTTSYCRTTPFFKLHFTSTQHSFLEPGRAYLPFREPDPCTVLRDRGRLHALLQRRPNDGDSERLIAAAGCVVPYSTRCYRLHLFS